MQLERVIMKFLWLLFLFSTIYGTTIASSQCQDGSCLPPQSISNHTETQVICEKEGAFRVPGTCDDYYLCEEISGHGMISSILRCPEGTTFDEAIRMCNTPSSTNNCTEGLVPLKRQKRFLDVIGKITGIVETGRSFINSLKGSPSRGSGAGLSSFENKLAGIEAKLDDTSLQVLQSQAERKISNKITQDLLKEVLIQNKEHIKGTKDLVHGVITQNSENLEKLRNAIVDGTEASKQNFAKLQGNLEKLTDIIGQEIAKAKSEINEGFISFSSSLHISNIEPIVSKLLTSIKDFKQRQDHVMSLPEKNKKDEIERSGGFIEYLESATLERTLRDIIYQNLAIPKSSSDVFAAFILDMLCDGLQFHAGILSSIVSSNMYLGRKALEEWNLDAFNTYMLRVHSSILRMESNLGFQSGGGLIKEIKDLIKNVGQLPFASNIPVLPQLLTERQSKLEQLEMELKEFVLKFTPLSVPGRISQRLDFADSSIPLPIGPWQKGKRVSYAVQFRSKDRVSAIGEWSRPYEISDRAHPTIHLPSVDGDITRLVYRKFDDGELAELVALITDRNKNSFRDIGRDLINAASRPNQQLAVMEVKLLVEDGADVNVRLDKTMAVPFHYAAEQNNVEVLKVLLSKGTNINVMSSDNMNALHYAASQGSNDALEFLLKEGGFINAQTAQFGWSPLHIAAANDNVRTALILLQNNAFSNIKDNMGLTPLHVSVLGSGEAMKLLLSTSSVDVNAKDNDGLTPLHHASRSSTATFTKLLLQHENIDVNALTKSRMSPLHYAAITGNVEICKLLIENKASLNIIDESGANPFHYAAFYGNTEATLLFLKENESLSLIKTSKGHTALDLARFSNKAEISLILSDGGKELIKDIEVIPPITPRIFPNTSGQTISPYSEYHIKAPNCVQNIMEEIGDRSEEVCSQIEKVSNYVDSVMTMVSVPVREEKLQVFAALKTSYNSVLQSAQSHVRAWNNGNSIMGSVLQTFALTKNFETNFNKKYNVYLTRASEISQKVQVQNFIRTLQREISDLETELQQTKSALTQAVSPVTKRYLQTRVGEIGALIEEKRQTLSVDPLIAEKLEELLYFLGEVVRDVDNIRGGAVDDKQQIQLFQSHVNADKQKLDRVAQEAMGNLRKKQQEIINKNADLRYIQVRQERLQAEVDGLRQDVKVLYNSIYETKRKLREERKALLRKYERTSTFGYFASFALNIVNKFAPFIIPPQLLQFVDVQKQSVVQQWQLNLQESQEQEEIINSMIRNKQKYLMQLREEIINGSRNSQALTSELNALNRVDFYLKDVTNELPSVHRSTSAIIGGLQRVDTVFTNIRSKIQEMINVGMSAKTTRDKQAALKTTFEALTDLQCYWKGSVLNIVNLKFCSGRKYQL